MTEAKRKIWFVRHAQSEYNKKHLFTGWHDPSLTEKGIEAALNLREELSPIDFNYVFCSPLKRASQTVQRITDKDKVIYDDRLKERSYGDWAG